MKKDALLALLDMQAAPVSDSVLSCQNLRDMRSREIVISVMVIGRRNALHGGEGISAGVDAFFA